MNPVTQLAPPFCQRRHLSPATEFIACSTLVASTLESIVLISRDLREHGITRFAAAGQPGSQLLGFFQRRYRLSGTLGGDPFDPDQRGPVLLNLPK